MSSSTSASEVDGPDRLTPPPHPARIASIVGFLVFTELASGIAQGWVIPLLPSFVERYGRSPADANWIVATALLSTLICVPVLAKLGDVYGHKRIMLVVVSAVVVGSVIVAVAPTFPVLLLGRALQGAISALLPLEFAIVRERAGEQANRAIGLLVGSLTVGASLGLLLAGLARQHLSLAATLWIPAVMMVVIVPFLVRLVPETTARRPGGIDWAGAALLGGGLALFLATVGNGSRWGWTEARTLAGLIGGAALLVIWVAIERRVTNPMVPLDVIWHRGQRIPLLTAFVFGAHLFGSSAPTASFLGTSPHAAGFGFGLSGTALGASLTVMGVAMTLSAAIAARLAEQVGQSATLVGGAVISAGAYLLTVLTRHDLAWFLVWQAGLGIGSGLVAAILPAIVVTRAPQDSVGIMSGLYNTSRTAAGSVAGAVFAAVMSAMVTVLSSGQAGVAESAYVVIWSICAVLSVTVGFLALAVTRSRRAIPA
ncbi:MFS family permease [Streptomyces sp. SAI-135]|nr:MFS family permease [Streptomyces sp. SAI-041]MDH6581823.1 MFS family permease [Streptomyces sp. SAI-133]MDH6613844.1 MFS family permease [Streptomyces sp. SAI-135]